MQFTIKVDKIPSVNSLYSYNPKTKSKYLTKEGRLYKERLKQSLQYKTTNLSNQFINDSTSLIENGLATEKDFRNKMIAYDLHVIFFLNSGILTRDTSNLIKATEDAIFEYLGINDSRVFHISSEKILNDIIRTGEGQEMITVILKPTGSVNNNTLSNVVKNTSKESFDDAIKEYINKRNNYV